MLPVADKEIESSLSYKHGAGLHLECCTALLTCERKQGFYFITFVPVLSQSL